MESIASAPTSIGQDIAQFRAEISATQSQIASKSGVDQSRVSRIERVSREHQTNSAKS